MNDEIKILDKKQFESDIETIVFTDKIPYFDAIFEYAEKHGIEQASIVELLRNSKPIKAKLEAECARANLLKTKGAQLPL